MSAHLVVGMGEVGKALAKVLERKYKVYRKDVEPLELPPGETIQTLHVCLNYYSTGQDRFVEIVREYLQKYNPQYLDVCSTVTPRTVELFGPNACHSTTRGLHPNLEEGLLKIVKHVGGPKAEEIARQYAKVGVRCVTHRSSRTTELAHILNNSAYGVSLMFADEMAKLCRDYGIDYCDAVMLYTATHNEGFKHLDHERLVRPILMPPGGHLGGHCVVQGASLIPREMRGELMQKLADYNGKVDEKKDGAGAAPDVPGVPEDGAALPLDANPDTPGGVGGGEDGAGVGACPVPEATK